MQTLQQNQKLIFYKTNKKPSHILYITFTIRHFDKCIGPKKNKNNSPKRESIYFHQSLMRESSIDFSIRRSYWPEYIAFSNSFCIFVWNWFDWPDVFVKLIYNIKLYLLHLGRLQLSNYAVTLLRLSFLPCVNFCRFFI